MVSCSVPQCDVTRRNNPNKYTFHRFPNNSVLREKWIRILNRVGWSPSKNSTICSKHFESKYFIQREHRRILLKDPIPTLFVPVQLKSRIPCSYVNRDILPPSVEPLPGPSRQVRSLSKEKLIKICSLLQRKLSDKNKILRNMKTRIKRMRTHLLNLQVVVNELNTLEFKDHTKMNKNM